MLPNLASCNREIGKYTVFFILVTSVSLQTFSFAVIPKFQGAGKKISLQIWVQVTVNDLLYLAINNYIYDRTKFRQTHLSNVAANMYFPLGENFTNDTGGLSSSEMRKVSLFKSLFV